MVRALVDPSEAWNRYTKRPSDWKPEDGESRIHVQAWMAFFREAGIPDASIHSNTVFARAFTRPDRTTYVGYNPDSVSKVITFSNGIRLHAPAKRLVIRVEQRN